MTGCWSIKKAVITAAVLTSTGMASDGLTVKIDSGVIEGGLNADSTLRVFKSVPFAAPPVGNLRWQPPQPVKHWTGVRKATEFGAHCMQAVVFNDILPRGKEMSEDCLNLTVWTPAKPDSKRLPVYVWFYGGGFAAGAEDEPRYDGESLARQGIVVVNVNYRLGVFGFLAHPELTKESAHHASGNFGMLDQVAAIEWVKRNIAAFSGDPGRITVGGESAGSLSVSALMASPLSRDLIHQAIGESGAFFGSVGGNAIPSLATAEKQGEKFAAAAAASSLADLRAKPAADLLAVASKQNSGFNFWPSVDGYFLPEDPQKIYAEGRQAHVPLLAGWNKDEVRMMVTLSPVKPSAKTFRDQLTQQFKNKSDEALKLYPASTDEQTIQSAGDLTSDNFIVYSTWKWIEEQAKTGKPVYRFQFDRPVPIAAAMRNTRLKTIGAAHATELEYVFNMLDSKKAEWTSEDRKTATAMNEYWANFISTGDPNRAGLARWPDYGKTREVMHLDVESHAAPEEHRDRYKFLESVQVVN
jgi:para-nitrobenzyl esterase